MQLPIKSLIVILSVSAAVFEILTFKARKQLVFSPLPRCNFWMKLVPIISTETECKCLCKLVTKMESDIVQASNLTINLLKIWLKTLTCVLQYAVFSLLLNDAK